MSYNHKARFVPVDEDINSATEIREVLISTSNVSPTNDEINKAFSRLRERVSSYASRNHWELYDFVSSYESDIFEKAEDFRKDIKSNFKWIDEVRTEKSDYESYHTIKHDVALSSEKVVNHIKDLYDIGFRLKAVKRSDNTTSIFYKWNQRYSLY